MSAPPQKAAPPPQILRVDTAFKLAQQWVNNMSKGVEDEPAQVESQGRHHRLGLGARVPRNPIFSSNDPVDWKLHAKLESSKKKTGCSRENSIPSAKGGDAEEDSSEDESESRSSLYNKKRVGPPPSAAQVRKKQK